MCGPTTLADLLRENLKDITPPEGYQEFRDRLAAMKPMRKPPTVKVSPENIRELRKAIAEET